MKKFEKLSRAEMKKVNGGGGYNCQEGKSCAYYEGLYPVNGTCTVSCDCDGSDGSKQANSAQCYGS